MYTSVFPLKWKFIGGYTRISHFPACFTYIHLTLNDIFTSEYNCKLRYFLLHNFLHFPLGSNIPLKGCSPFHADAATTAPVKYSEHLTPFISTANVGENFLSRKHKSIKINNYLISLFEAWHRSKHYLKKSVPTSGKIHRVSSTRTNQLMQFGELITAYCASHMQQTMCGKCKAYKG